MKYLWEVDYIECDIFVKTKLKIKGVRYDAPDILSVTEIKNLFGGLYRQRDHAETHFQKFCGLRNIVLIEMLCFSGIRISELCSLSREDISFIPNAYIIQIKGYRERNICVEDKAAVDNLSLYCCTFKDQIEQTEQLFVNNRGQQLSDQAVRRIVNRAAKSVGIYKKVTPKMLRDTLADIMLKQNYSVRELQCFLGDKALTTTEKRTKNIKKGNISIIKHSDANENVVEKLEMRQHS